jgi:hypothetical protein
MTLDVIGVLIAHENTFRGARSALPDAPVVPDGPVRSPSALRRWTAARLAGIAQRLDPENVRPRVTCLQGG